MQLGRKVDENWDTSKGSLGENKQNRFFFDFSLLIVQVRNVFIARCIHTQKLQRDKLHLGHISPFIKEVLPLRLFSVLAVLSL